MAYHNDQMTKWVEGRRVSEEGVAGCRGWVGGEGGGVKGGGGHLGRLGGAGTGLPLVLVALRICTGAVFVLERLVMTLPPATARF